MTLPPTQHRPTKNLTPPLLRSRHHARSVEKPFGPGRLFLVICDATLNVAASLLLLAAGPVSPDVALASPARFECSSCKKTFGSHQALGGHRASHKNVKGCFAITKSATDVEDDQCLGWPHEVPLEKSEEQASRSLFGLPLGSDSRPSQAQCGVDLNLPVRLLEDGSSSTTIDSSNNMQLELKLGI
uniref:C2H2-type domain-containing protein n=1 Tax=Chenopodium quinoa TaxID=63459 RepID=A0A803LG21_CHEQI